MFKATCILRNLYQKLVCKYSHIYVRQLENIYTHRTFTITLNIVGKLEYTFKYTTTSYNTQDGPRVPIQAFRRSLAPTRYYMLNIPYILKRDWLIIFIKTPLTFDFYHNFPVTPNSFLTACRVVPFFGANGFVSKNFIKKIFWIKLKYI